MSQQNIEKMRRAEQRAESTKHAKKIRKQIRKIEYKNRKRHYEDD